MARRRKNAGARFRIGKVSGYFHHGAWWAYYREAGKPIRKKVAAERAEAEKVGAQINAQLSVGSPTLLAFTPIGIPDLRSQFLDYHEQVLRSSLATICRYRTATQHLENFDRESKPRMAHLVSAERFVAYLRKIEVAPNGHANSAKRHLRDKGVQFILETCPAMYGFAAKRRHLPPYSPNPFGELPLDHLKIEDAKPIFVFDHDTELAFFQNADAWSLPIHALLSKTGLRVGEAVHLLIEDLDLKNGWLRVRNKPGLGWRIKTGNERNVPLIPEIVHLLRQVIGKREAGLVFLRPHFFEKPRPLSGLTQSELEAICQDHRKLASAGSCRQTFAHIATAVWNDAGAVKPDAIRISFIRTAKRIGHSEATCPKSWRHTFATLLQDANVDPLIRQITLGHRPTTGAGLGMTANYTHTRPETQREQIEKALRLWPRSLALLLTKEGFER